MPVYTINGAATNDAYTLSAQKLTEAYDINNNQLLDHEPQALRVMTYNVQWWTNLNGQAVMQKEIIDKYKADLIGFQEFSLSKSIPSLGAQVLSDYPSIVLGNHKNYSAVASKVTLEDITIADFQTQDPGDMEQYNETRYYIKGYIRIGGRKICVLNTHLGVFSSAARGAQAAELLAIANSETNVIITGDFNLAALDFESADYTGVFKIFLDAGYRLANYTPTTGITKTFTNKTTAETLDDFNSAPDNIIVSSNIDIRSVVFDTTKLKYLNGGVIDHIPIIIDIMINS